MIGITGGKPRKHISSAILAQHGVVLDAMADEPIAVIWQRRFASGSVRLRPGMPFAFPSESAFSFAGSALPYRIYCDGFAHGETALRVEEVLRRTLDALKFETTEMLPVVGL